MELFTYGFPISHRLCRTGRYACVPYIDAPLSNHILFTLHIFQNPMVGPATLQVLRDESRDMKVEPRHLACGTGPAMLSNEGAMQEEIQQTKPDPMFRPHSPWGFGDGRARAGGG